MKPTLGRALALVLWLALISPCLAEQPTLCPGATVPLDISAAGSKPFVRMRLGGHEGNFLIDTGSTFSSVDAALYGASAGSTIKISGSSLPTVDEGTFFVIDQSPQTPFAPSGGVAGVIGADILGSRIVEFHYEAESPYLALATQRCGPRTFEDAGLVPIRQQGFGTPETWLSWLATRMGFSHPDTLPIIYARFGPISAPLWLASGLGFSATRHTTIFINDAIDCGAPGSRRRAPATW